MIINRIPAESLQKYEELRFWLKSADANEPLDYFLSRIFSELLAQPGFGFAESQYAGADIARLIQSYQKFKQPFKASLKADDASYLGGEYYRTLNPRVAFSPIPAG